jgi:hypothetical protein
MEGAIDRSYWHLNAEDMENLHPEDRDNPIWCDEIGEEIGKRQKG